MANLNYSSFMNLLHEHLVSVEKETLARGLLASFTNENIYDELGSSYLSRIWTGQRDLVAEIKDLLEKKTAKAKCLEFFKTDIYPSLRKELIDDFFDKLIALINSDNTISDSKKKKILDTYTSSSNVEFLALVFIYAANKHNKRHVNKVEIDDAELFEEVNQECPLCNCSLIKNIHSKTLYYYTVVKIFPANLSSERELDFHSCQPRPANSADKINKICLCDRCGSEYSFHPTISTYNKLYDIKGYILNNKIYSKIANQNQLDDDIKYILSDILQNDIDGESFNILRMKPIDVKNKILPTNKALLKAIKDNNDYYYNFIKDYLSTMDSYKISFKKIANNINNCYLELSRTIDDQNIIFYRIIQWIMVMKRLPDKYRTAAHVIVSFFVQNCEVFDEITE